MRIERHPGRSGGPPLGTIYGGVGVMAAGLAALWFSFGFPRPVCHFRSLTGIACPTCGTTRLVEALLGGDVAGAFAWNPLVFAGMFAVAVWAIVATVRWTIGAPAMQVRLEPRERLALGLTGAAAVTGGWVYLILQGV